MDRQVKAECNQICKDILKLKKQLDKIQKNKKEKK